MKVRELIEQLQGLDGDMEVFLQGDPEGNRYWHIHGVDGDDAWTAQVRDNTWSSPLSGEDLDWYASEYDEEIGEFIKCVVIYPSHACRPAFDSSF